MTLDYFQQLTAVQKYILILRKGILVADRREDKDIVLLYQLDEFYIEATFNDRLTSLKHIHTFSSTVCLDVYLEQIDISDVL